LRADEALLGAFFLRKILHASPRKFCGARKTALFRVPSRPEFK
jgi:hypothetical protein